MTGADAAVYITVPSTIDPRSERGFSDAINRAVANSATRAIVLRGGNGVFCRGLDLSAFNDSHAEPSMTIANLAECLLTLRRSPAAVVAVVDGVVLGGGVGLVAASDFVIATDTSSFGLPEALFGFAPSIILPFLLERMRPQLVRLWALSAYARSAAEAVSAGLVDLVVPPGEVERQTTHWVRQLSRTLAEGTARVKRITAEAPGLSLEMAVRKGVEATSQALTDSRIARSIRNCISEDL